MIIFLFLISTVGFSQETPRALYDAGKYQDALALLEQNGLRTASDYYNAGNALFRLGKTGKALSYFEKANALAPTDDDIKYNLKIAQDTVNKTGGLVKDQTFWSGTFVPFARTIPEELLDLLLALTTAGIGFLAYRAKKKSLRFTTAVLHPGFLFTLAAWSFVCAVTTATVLAHRMKLAAVVADMGVARSGPNETFTELFKLPAGTKVELTGETREGWQQIRFSLGNVGWIMEKDLLSL